MKRTILSLLIFFVFLIALDAQDTITEPVKPPTNKQKPPLSKRIYFGGGLGLSFGTYTRIALYPMVGVQHSEKFRTGVQFGFEYVKDNRYTTSIESTNYGISLLAQYNIIPQLYLHVEPAIYNFDANYLFINDKDRVWVPFFYVGAGYAQRIGGNSFMYFQAKYDVIQSSDSPYSSWPPLIEVGIRAGF